MSKKNPLFWLVGLSFLLMFLDYFGQISFLKSTAEIVIVPTKQTVFRIYKTTKNLQEVISFFPQLNKIVNDNRSLERKVNELALRVKLLEKENDKLRHQLAAPLPASYQFIPAQVIAVSRFMEIAVGSNEGVKINMPVVDGTVYLGKIVSVSAKRSYVKLPVDSEATIPAKTLQGTKGVVVGQGGRNIILGKVLQKDHLFLSDQVLTSGEGGYPANLLIGTIVYIDVNDVSTYKQAKISPALDYLKEEVVFVISSL